MNTPANALRNSLLALALASFVAISPSIAQAKNTPFGDSIAREVRHELVQIPYFSVFDNLGYSVNGSVVTLNGQVRNPVIKDEAQNAVKSISGVTKVVNNIQVLPLSPMDDHLRIALYRAIYGDPSLQRYSLGVLQPIRIIVNQGHVTLEGIVDNEADRDLAGIRANGVPGTFSVTNNLRVETRH